MSSLVYVRKNPTDGSIGYRIVAEGTPPTPEEKIARYANGSPVEEDMIWLWVKDKVWDDLVGAPRDRTVPESLEAVRTAKRTELEERFTSEWQTYFSDPVFAVVAYVELKSDPRTVALTTAKNNLMAKESALANLGRPGQPPLTEANIAGINW